MQMMILVLVMVFVMFDVMIMLVFFRVDVFFVVLFQVVIGKLVRVSWVVIGLFMMFVLINVMWCDVFGFVIVRFLWMLVGVEVDWLFFDDQCGKCFVEVIQMWGLKMGIESCLVVIDFIEYYCVGFVLWVDDIELVVVRFVCY